MPVNTYIICLAWSDNNGDTIGGFKVVPKIILIMNIKVPNGINTITNNNVEIQIRLLILKPLLIIDRTFFDSMRIPIKIHNNVIRL